MGFPPAVIDQMSLWEFNACVDGYRRAQGVEDEVEPPSYHDHLKMVQAARAMQARVA